MTANLELIPDNAPFSSEQRAWLNGFFAGLLALDQVAPGQTLTAAPEAQEEEYPWHDPAIEIEERMKLAQARPFELQLMAAMGQLDCGQCGYLCKTYAEVIAQGEETDLSLCVPGGRATAKKLKELMSAAPAVAPRAKLAPTGPVTSIYTRKHPFNAKLKDLIRLTGPSSIKDTRHIVIDLAGSGITYEPGDALGVFPQNCPHLVEAILAALGATGEEAVDTPAGSMPARQALLEVYDLTKPTDEVLLCLSGYASDPLEAEQLKHLAQGSLEEGVDVLDLLEDFPSARPPLPELLMSLGRLQPRLYSIASSLKAYKDEVHLTVGVVRYERKQRVRKGVASTFFVDRLITGDTVKVYVQATYSFRLPRDNNTPIIMIGPGTGIAPFRAFLEERRARSAQGRNWLFFGNPNSKTDFLYQSELEDHLKEGVLTLLPRPAR
jgi:sulfite reductase (NADPH) flavoprotein alpha-component